MAIRKNTNPRQMDIQPEMRDILMRNGMQAHIVPKGDGYQLAVQGHDSPLLTYDISEAQMLALTDWGTNSANKKAYNVFTGIIEKDFDMPRNFVHARNANGRVAMGLHGYRVGDGELTNEARAELNLSSSYALQGGRRPIGQYGRRGMYAMHMPGTATPPFLGWTPRQQDGYHLRRVGGQLFFAERPDGRMKPGEMQSGGYGFYFKGQQQQVVQPSQDVLQSLQAVVTPMVSRPRSAEPAKPYKELITSQVYFSNEKWQECLQSHGIIIDADKKTLTIQSDKVNADMVYDLKDEELQALTDNSIKRTPIDKRLEIMNNVIGGDFADKITMDMLNSKERIGIDLKPEVRAQLEQNQQQTVGEQETQNLSVKQEQPRLQGDAVIDGKNLDLLNENKGWYREGKHGREVQVDEISVEKGQTDGNRWSSERRDELAQSMPSRDRGRTEFKYRMTAVINGEAVTHEISQKQYDKFLAVDDYHRMKLFSNIFKEVDMKNRPGANAGLGTKIFAALTAGAVVASEVAHGRHMPEVYVEHHEHTPAPRPFFKPGVDSPQDVAARNFEAAMNREVTEMRRGY